MYGGDAIKVLGSGIISFARQGITAAATALPGLIGSVWSFTAALLANPVTWIVVGMIALGVALALLAKKLGCGQLLCKEQVDELREQRKRWSGSSEQQLPQWP